jgi:hypothetical protein
VIAAGERIPDVRVWRSTAAAVSLPELAAEGPFLLLLYLFDWTST